MTAKQLVHFLALVAVLSLVTGILLALIYANISTGDVAVDELVASGLWKVFFVLLIVEGVISWLFVLAHESHAVAQEESQIQTQYLVAEIEAHQKTDKQLQEAKEAAETANNAKSRYLTGISHEFRSPLNTVLGYAQLMVIDPSTPEATREQAAVIKRSGEHLADLIEGLLDISKIEAGRLDIQRGEIRIDNLMTELVNMFRLQASDKGLEFAYSCKGRLPEVVMGDEKRVRQILINLLSNAIKFTDSGGVNFSISYRNQVAEFNISDTGVGVPEAELERIFKPFERVRRPGSTPTPGTGLGLTITRLLADIMGGDMVLRNNPEGGVTATVWLMLSNVVKPTGEVRKTRRIFGYTGPRKSALVVDDDAAHRGVIGDLLVPIGFNVIEAHDGESCLAMVKSFTPDIFFIDRLMPGIDGPTLAQRLRELQFAAPILMVTANANEDLLRDDEDPAYDEYLIKPIRLENLLARIAFHLDIVWDYSARDYEASPVSRVELSTSDFPSNQICEEIVRAAEVGHMSALKAIVRHLDVPQGASQDFVDRIEQYIKQVKFKEIITLLAARSRDSIDVI